MKMIMVLFFSATSLFAQSSSLFIKASDKNTLLLSIPFQLGDKSFSRFLVQEQDISKNVQIIFADSTSDPTVQQTDKIFLRALIGSVSLGAMGALIGLNINTECAGSSDVFQICSGDGYYARLGATIGGVSGSILGYLARRKNIQQKAPVLKIVLGSIAGGVVGYYLADKTFGMSTLIFPPIGANILLHF